MLIVSFMMPEVALSPGFKIRDSGPRYRRTKKILHCRGSISSLRTCGLIRATMNEVSSQEARAARGTWSEVLSAFLRLGLTSFGGPVAHLGYFRDEFVTRRRWLDDRSYADLVALCQFLPGPASSQVGI